MCLSPNTFRNPRLDFRLGLDKQYITAPCGHCAQCLQQKRDDLFVRMYYEFRKSRNVFFVTFTYNNDSLPLVDLCTPAFDCLRKFVKLPYYQDVPSFNKTSFRNTIKKLRQMILRDYDVDGIRYFVGCENGDKNNRPHYHVLFFLPRTFNISDNEFMSYCVRAWGDEITDLDTIPSSVILESQSIFANNKVLDYYIFEDKHNYNYFVRKDKRGKLHFFLKRGFVNYSQDYGAKIHSTQALKYVTKYLTKDTRFMSLPAINDIYKCSKSLPPLKDFANDSAEALAIRSIKDIFPFYLISNGLGDDLLHELSDKSELPDCHNEAVEFICKNQIEVDTEAYTYHIPRYIIRKLFFEVQDVYRTEPVFNKKFNVAYNSQKIYITPLGQKCLKIMSQLKCHNMSTKYKVFFNDNFLRSLKYYCTDVQRNMLDSIMLNFDPSVNLDLLPFYKLFLKDVCTYGMDHLNYALDSTIDINVDNFISAYYDSYNILYKDTLTPFSSHPDYDYFIKHYGTYNDLSIFKGYDNTLELITQVECIVGDLMSRSEVIKNAISDRLKYFYNHHYYV